MNLQLAVPAGRLVLFSLLLAAGFGGVARGEDLLTFQVVARAGRLEPSRLEVPAGKKIKIQLRNDGPGPIEFESAELRVEKVLGPGANSFVVLHPLRQGTYRFFDEFHPETGECLVIAK